MCGFIALYSKNDSIDQNNFKYLRDLMLTRGPDAKGMWRSGDGKSSIGHRRLKIIDLTDNASQPMFFHDRSSIIAFNGEIYNYRELRLDLTRRGSVFKSESDTEVILECYRHYGEQLCNYLDGMFSFIIDDFKSNKILIGRDRSGEKPLYYTINNSFFLVSSSLECFLKNEKIENKISKKGLSFYLTFGHSGPIETLLDNVYKLPASHLGIIDKATWSLKAKPYWAPEIYPNLNSEGANDVVSKFEILLSHSVSNCLHSDVDNGILLSGGLDSSLITALASKISLQKIKTFSVSFPGFTDLDEIKHANLIAEYFKTDHKVLKLESIKEDVFEKVFATLDEPLADHAIIPTYLLAEMISKEVKVAISGDGSDELFGGYNHYIYLQKLASVHKYTPTKVAAWVQKLGQTLPVGFKGRNHLLAFGQNPTNARTKVNCYFDPLFISDLIKDPDGIIENYATQHVVRTCQLYESSYAQMRLVDFLITLQCAYTTKADRASMAHSLELRTPFLSKALLEFSYGNFFSNIENGKDLKVLPKLLGRKLLPDNFQFQRKQGFTMPLKQWLVGGLNDFFRSYAYSNNDIFNAKMIDELYRYNSTYINNSHRIYLIALLNYWMARHNVYL